MDYVVLVLGIIVIGFSIAIMAGVLRAVFSIPEFLRLQREILAELRRQSSHFES